MPPLEINQSRCINCSVRLDEPIAAQFAQYTAFIHSSADDVVGVAKNYVFPKDRDFQELLKTPQARQVGSTLRIRKGPSRDAAEHPTKKLAARVTPAASVGVARAWILHSVLCRSKRGASHRKNRDTPPLGGNCRETCECSRGTVLLSDR